MKSAFSRALDSVSVGRPLIDSGLGLFPLYLNAGQFLDADAGVEALRSGAVSIDETNSVPVLRLNNTGLKPVLFPAGDTLVGGAQNRALNVTVIAAPKMTLDVPVSCVERRRWDGSRQPFTAGGAVLAPSIRSTQMRMVTEDIRRTGQKRADQGMVWAGVEEELERRHVTSPTAAYNDGHRPLSLRRASDAGPLPGQCGVALCRDDEVLGVDLFGGPELLRAYWRPIVTSYQALHAGRRRPSADRVFRFLQRLGTAEQLTTDAVGLGEEIRLYGSTVTAQAVMVHGIIGHLAAHDPRVTA